MVGGGTYPGSTLGRGGADISSFPVSNTVADADTVPFTDTSEDNDSKRISLTNLINRFRSGMALVTATAKGLMSGADKTKLDSIETGATADQKAADVPTDTTSFGGNLSGTDNNVQAALGTLDDLDIGSNALTPSNLEAHITISPPLSHVSVGNTYFIGLPDATEDASGAMSDADKTKLDAIDSDADDISAFDTETTVASADFMPFIDVSASNAGKKILFTNFLTRVRAGMALATQSARGLMSAADKTKLDGLSDSGGVALDTTNFTGNLDSDDDSVQDLADTFDQYIPHTLEEFVFGAAYEKSRIVRYQDVLYRSKVAIADANEIPPLDDTRWAEQSSHRMEGYGEIFDQDSATVEFNTVSFEAKSNDATRETVAAPLSGTLHDGLPQALLVITDGKFKARVDGVALLFDTNYEVFFITTQPTDGAAQVSLTLQAKKTTDQVWTIIGTGTVFLADGTGSDTLTIAMLNRSFSLDTDEELEFQWAYILVTGTRGSALTYHTPTNDLVVKVSGIHETRHVLAHGIGDNAGKITIEESTDDVTTAIIDIEAAGGPTYVGPMALRVFAIGEDYGQNEIVEFEDVLYRAIADIADASEIPSLDTANWSELSGHGIEGYGISVNDVSVVLSFEDVATAVFGGTIQIVSYDLTLTEVTGLQTGVGHIDDEGRLVADNDGLEVRFAAGQTVQWLFDADGDPAGHSTFAASFFGQKNDEDRQEIATTGSLVLDSGVDSHTLDFTTQSRVFQLNRGDTLQFDIGLIISRRAAGTLSQGADETRAVPTLSGYRHTRYSIHWGSGDQDGQLLAEDHDTETPILEFRSGIPTYLGAVANSIPEIIFGSSYKANNVIRYQDVIYRARVDIPNASELPALDTTDWAEVDTHSFKGYGTYIIDAPIAVDFHTANLAVNPGLPFFNSQAIALSIFESEGLPSLYLEVDEGTVTGLLDGVVVTIRADDDWEVTMAGTSGDNGASGILALHARKNNTGNWVPVKQVNWDWEDTDTTQDLDLSNDSDVSFELDDGDTLNFRVFQRVTSGSMNAATVTDREDLPMDYSGSRGGVQEISFGTGANVSVVQAYDPVTGITTNIIEFGDDGTARWVGPLQGAIVQDDNLETPGSMTGEILDGGPITFTIVDPAVIPSHEDEIFPASHGGDTQVELTVTAAQEAVIAADALVFYGVGGADDGQELAQFRVISHTTTGIIDTDGITELGRRVVFTGNVVSEFSALDPFEYGSIGDEVEVAFLKRSPVSAAIPYISSRTNTILGYRENGRLATREDEFLAITVPRPRGIPLGNYYPIRAANDAGGNDDSDITEFTIEVGSNGAHVEHRFNFYQAKSDPGIDFRDWIAVRDIIEMQQKSSGNHNLYSVLEVTTTSYNDSHNQVRVRCKLLRHGYVIEAVGDEALFVTNRHGRLVAPEVYNSNVNFTVADRFLRVDLGHDWDDFDFLGISFFNDHAGNMGFAYREIPVSRLRECFAVDSDNEDNPSSTPQSHYQYFAFFDRVRPDDDLRWGLARSNHGDGYRGIAIYVEDTGDDPQPLRVDYIMQR